MNKNKIIAAKIEKKQRIRIILNKKITLFNKTFIFKVLKTDKMCQYGIKRPRGKSPKKQSCFKRYKGKDNFTLKGKILAKLYQY